jgi:small basic protein (TIGR04137 family)
MSVDRSLKGGGALQRHRNVLKRSERISKLEADDKWAEERSGVFGLVKVGHRKAVVAKKAPKAAAEAGATVATPGAPAAAAAAAAPAAKGGKK